MPLSCARQNSIEHSRGKEYSAWIHCVAYCKWSTSDRSVCGLNGLRWLRWQRSTTRSSGPCHSKKAIFEQSSSCLNHYRVLHPMGRRCPWVITPTKSILGFHSRQITAQWSEIILSDTIRSFGILNKSINIVRVTIRMTWKSAFNICITIYRNTTFIFHPATFQKKFIYSTLSFLKLHF